MKPFLGIDVLTTDQRRMYEVVGNWPLQGNAPGSE